MAILNKPSRSPVCASGACSRGGNGDGLFWMSKPYPYLPYRHVMAMYPRDTQVQQWSNEPAQRHAYSQAVYSIHDGRLLADPTTWRAPMPQ